MSFVARLWNSIRNPVRYVGRDLHGNKFYEAHSPNDPSRPKRTVEYYQPEDMWQYIGGNRRLPIQWSAWLTHTRPIPPTIEELQADVLRQQRVSANVALIEERDRAEREEMLRVRQQDAARALQEAAARNEGVPLVSEPAGATAASKSALGGDVAHTSTVVQQQHPEAAPLAQTTPSTATATSTPTSTAHATPKVLPPKFVTPATPRKSRTSAKFALPSFSEGQDGAKSASLEPQPEPKFEAKRKEEAAKEKGSSPPPPMPSRPVSETESWRPKARRRG